MPPDTKDLRHPQPNVIDQRAQQIDPAGKNRRDWNKRPNDNTLQPGGSNVDKAQEEGKKLQSDD